MHPGTPTPSPEHARLIAAMAGDWVAEEKTYPSAWDPHGGSSRGRSRARAGLGGLFLISDYVQEKDGQPVFYGHGVYGHDPVKERYTMQWWDSMAVGGGGLVPGTWNDNTLCFESSAGSRYVYEFLGPDAYRFAIELSRDGGQTWAPMMEGQFRRAAA